MRSFLLAALAGVSIAQSLENKNAVLTAFDVASSSGAVYATIEEISTGWKKNGSGTDATFDAKLWINWKKASNKNYVNAAESTIYLGIANEAGDKWEGNKFAYNSSGVVAMSYAEMAGALPATLAASTYSNSGYNAKMEESGITLSPSITAPAGFWNYDAANSANNATNYWMGLTRSSPGAADIVTGATRKMRLQLDYFASAKQNTLYNGELDAAWLADTSEEVPDNTDGGNTEGGDNTPDNTDNTDGMTDDDGATGVTTFAAAVVAAIASMMF